MIQLDSFRKFFRLLYYKLWLRTPKRIISHVYKKVIGDDINWEMPKTLNEKINWLKINSDTSIWTRLADKYLVREFIKENDLSNILVPLIGKWSSPDDIDFEKLPNSFVLKTNHGSGEIIVVKDKSLVNQSEIKEKLKQYLKEPYGYFGGEFHYMLIDRCIIAEELLIDKNKSFSTSLIDYKVWCFNGEPYLIWTCYSRTHDYTYVTSYDCNWNYHPEYSVYNDHYRDGGNKVPCPKTLKEMLNVARILSKGFPQVRIDFYDVNDKLYFGEMTFTSAGGYMTFYTKEALIEFGNQINLYATK